MPSFRAEATGMASMVYFLDKVAKAIQTRLRENLWSYNASLVRRVKKLTEHDPISAHLRNNHNAYRMISRSLENVKVTEVGHV